LDCSLDAVPLYFQNLLKKHSDIEVYHVAAVLRRRADSGEVCLLCDCCAFVVLLTKICRYIYIKLALNEALNACERLAVGAKAKAAAVDSGRGKTSHANSSNNNNTFSWCDSFLGNKGNAVGGVLATMKQAMARRDQ
jgi:hypothetical protein